MVKDEMPSATDLESRVGAEAPVGSNRIHLHSMLVHSVIGLAVLAAGACAFETLGRNIGRLGPELWPYLRRASLLGLLLLSVPAILTGIADRDRMYANWHRSHRAKLILSLLLVTALAGELVAMLAAPDRLSTWLGAGVVANVVIVLALAAYGLRITLGRQSFAPTSYLPDMQRKPPVDILETVGAAAAAEPTLIDPSEEDAA